MVYFWGNKNDNLFIITVKFRFKVEKKENVWALLLSLERLLGFIIIMTGRWNIKIRKKEVVYLSKSVKHSKNRWYWFKTTQKKSNALF
jgi:hypothetical protein